ncbi:nuclear transport factor 2 family protein [Sphingobacterium sp. SG20118]|uniref:nuclear transport factor 2 family protein n=1 Tax=Sphingobacterium TaxID=28453 RepID=UPI0004F7CDE9|nr:MULTISPECIES: nuclear transport factor 2 family protein [Sphingobacterium]AIM36748.1 hypothetical protein KO02_08590 [Sphingobacterium sp. ML3W]MDH5827102.1 nuclear transport factor 2 family protein [Sphingobacterium faecium]
MKNSLTSIFLVLALIGALVVLTNSSSAKDKIAKNTDPIAVIDSYIQITTVGNTEGIQKLFSNDFKWTQSSNAKTKTYNKTDLVNFLKVHKGLIQNCKTSYSIMEKNDNCVMAKVEMKYDNFTKVECITLCNENQEWKITQIIESYK